MSKALHMCGESEVHLGECSDCSQLEQRVENLEECCEDVNEALAGKQDVLESGENIKTINGESVLGSGNIEIQGGGGDTVSFTQTQQSGNELGTITINGTGTNIYSPTETDPTVPSWAKASTKPSYTASEVGAVPTSRTVNGKALSSNINLDASDVGAQDALVSGTNIKTVNGNSLLGSGDLAISGGGAKNVWYGTCSTGSNTNQKVATTTSGDFTLTTGNIVSITFSNANGVSASLNVDSTGDVSIRMTSGSSVNALYWTAGETVTFVYNGTYYLAVGKGTATTTYYGVTKLSTSTSSTSDTVAATPSAVKAAYDLANGKQDALVSGTNIKTINNNSLLGSGDLTIPTGTTATVTQVSLTVANWNATTTCTKSVAGVTTSNSVIVSPAPASIADYVSAGVYCSAQGSGTLTFTASSTPTADLVVNVMIVG